MPLALRPPIQLVVALIAVVSAGIAPAAAQHLEPLDPGPLKGAWLVPDDAPRTHVELVVLAGERDNDGPRGLAHYTEHLVWLSATRPASGATRPDTGGAHSNAATTSRATHYYLDGPPERLDAMLASLARTLRPVDLPEAFMREEVGIVRGEFERGVRESPWSSLWRDLGRMQHGRQWPARSVIGTPETMARFTPDAALRFHRRTHRPGNAVLVVKGPHGPDAAARAVAAAFPAHGAGAGRGRLGDASDERPDGGPLAPPAYRARAAGRVVEERIEPRLGAPELMQSRLIELEDPPPFHDLAARQALLHDALDSTRAGGLAGPLRYDAFIAERYELSFEILDERRVEMTFSARPDRGVTLAELHDAFEATLAASAARGLPSESVELVRSRALAELDALERPANAVLDGALASIASGATPIPLADWRRRLAAVEPADVNALLRAFADASRTATLLVSTGNDR